MFREPERGQYSSFIVCSAVPGPEKYEKGETGNLVKGTINTLQIILRSAYVCLTELIAIMHYTFVAYSSGFR